jgi:hypothetical protein
MPCWLDIEHWGKSIRNDGGEGKRTCRIIRIIFPIPYLQMSTDRVWGFFDEETDKIAGDLDADGGEEFVVGRIRRMAV